MCDENEFSKEIAYLFDQSFSHNDEGNSIHTHGLDESSEQNNRDERKKYKKRVRLIHGGRRYRVKDKNKDGTM